MEKLTKDEANKYSFGSGNRMSPERADFYKLLRTLEVGEAYKFEESEYPDGLAKGATNINHYFKRHGTRRFAYRSCGENEGMIIKRIL